MRLRAIGYGAIRDGNNLKSLYYEKVLQNDNGICTGSCAICRFSAVKC